MSFTNDVIAHKLSIFCSTVKPAKKHLNLVKH